MIAAERAQLPTTGRVPSFTPMGIGLAIVVIGIAALVAAQMWVSALPPVRAGSVSAVLGETEPCSGDEVGTELPDCQRVPFVEGSEVGIGFTMRNDAPIGMTILSVEVIREGVLTPAVLEPQLTTEDTLLGLTEGVPFAPVEVPAGGQQAIQFVGTYGACDTAAVHYLPGSGLSVSQAFATVRWGFLTTEVQIPLPTALALAAPTSCP